MRRVLPGLQVLVGWLKLSIKLWLDDCRFVAVVAAHHHCRRLVLAPSDDEKQCDDNHDFHSMASGGGSAGLRDGPEMLSGFRGSFLNKAFKVATEFRRGRSARADAAKRQRPWRRQALSLSQRVVLKGGAALTDI